MTKLLFLFAYIIYATPTAKADCISLNNWLFHGVHEDAPRPILVGISLTDPAQHLRSFDGVYSIELSSNLTSRFKSPTLYLPAIGGLNAISVAGRDIVLPKTDYSGVGPVFKIPKHDLGSVFIRLAVSGDRSSYAGLWKGSPQLCEESDAEQRRTLDKLWQETVPGVISVICFCLSVIFLLIFRATQRKVAIYLLFSAAAFSWSIFFGFLSGFIREIHYGFGASSIFPFRIAASFGLVLLLYSYRSQALSRFDKWNLAIAACLVGLGVLFSLVGNTDVLMSLLGLCLLTQLPVGLSLISKKSEGSGLALTRMLALITIAGEILDLLKLLGPQFGWISPLPYLARITIPPIIFISAVYFLRNFSSYYRSSRLAVFQRKKFARIASIVERCEFNDAVLAGICRMVRRVVFARAAVLFKRENDGGYTVVRSFGRQSNISITSAVSAADFQKCTSAGTIASGQLNKMVHGDTIAVPLPFETAPAYVFYFAGLVAPNALDENAFDLCYQVFFSLSSAFKASSERQSRETLESKSWFDSVSRAEERRATLQVAHDIQSPIATLEMLSASQNIGLDGWQVVRSAVRRIREISSDLVSSERRQAQSQKESVSSIEHSGLEAYPLFPLLKEVVLEKGFEFSTKPGISIEIIGDTNTTLACGLVQPIEFKRLLSNLLNNSFQAFTGSRGSIRVKMNCPDDQLVKIVVSDDGVGIHSDLLPKLGEMGVSFGKPGGCGLGLYHAQKTARSWGGGIEVRSEAGAGTDVTVFMKRAPHPEWLISTIGFKPKTSVVLIGNDHRLMEFWEIKSNALGFEKIEINVLSFPTATRFLEYYRENFWLIDAKIFVDGPSLPEVLESIKVLAESKVAIETTVVTDYFSEPDLIDFCRSNNVKVIPKVLIYFVDVSLEGLRA